MKSLTKMKNWGGWGGGDSMHIYIVNNLNRLGWLSSFIYVFEWDRTYRGIPHKIVATPDGTTILVCAGRGVTVHRLSAVSPLEFIDEWQVTESEELSSNNSHAFDVDLGPSLNRPVVAAAACSNGVLRLHGLAGISAFSERHNKVGISQSVGSLIAAPARRFKNVFGRASATANKAAGVGKDISKEITSNVKERGVTGFLGGMFGKK